MNTICWFFNWAWQSGRKLQTSIAFYLVGAFLTYGWHYNVFGAYGEAAFAGYLWFIYVPGKMAVWLFS